MSNPVSVPEGGSQPPRPPSARSSIGLWGIAALGVGSMIGAGIFALLGQATLQAGRGVVVSFILAGVVALFSGYSYAKLAVRYPTSGGILDYFNQGLPSRVLAGALSLMYLITLAVSTSMVAKTFGSYVFILLEGFALPVGRDVVVNLCASGIIVLMTLINLIGADAVGKAENLIVGSKLIILLCLMAVGLYTLDMAHFRMEPSRSVMPVLGSVGLTFFAFAGFGMMTNAAAETPHPEKTIPRAIFLAIGTVMVIYLGLAVVVLGNLAPGELLLYRDTAIAHAAKPVLGHAGFVIVSFAALLATSSAINAMIFSSMRIAIAMAKREQLPASFGVPVRGMGTRGFLWAIAGVVVMTNLLDLGAVANIASATFLLSYFAVIACHWRLRRETKSNGLIILAGLASILGVLGVFSFNLAQNNPKSLWFVGIFVILAFATEMVLAWRDRGKKDNSRKT